MRYDEFKWNEDKSKTIKVFDEIRKTLVEINKFAYMSCGTALTIYRDGFIDDYDIDFTVHKDNLGKMLLFLDSTNLKILSKVFWNEEISFVQLIHKGVTIDLSVADYYFDETLSVPEYRYHGKEKVGISGVKFHSFHPKDPKLSEYKGIRHIADPLWFSNRYGEKWNVKMEGKEFLKYSRKNKSYKLVKNKKKLKSFKVDFFL